MKFLTILFYTLTQFINSEIAVNSNAKCPCVVNPHTNGCLKYDSRFQASSVDEAIDFFEDMSLLFEKKPAEKAVNYDDLNCSTQECKTCRRMMSQRLRQVGFFEDFYGAEGYKNFIEPVEHNPDEVADTCRRYRFARENSDTIEYKKSAKKRKRVRHLEENPPYRRARQVVDTVNATLIGTRYNLSCTTKGSTPDGNKDNGLLSLCSKCWAWRQLPSNYFPQFISLLHLYDTFVKETRAELHCSHGHLGLRVLEDSYGTCSSGERTVEVLRNDTYKLTMVTLSAAAFCECQVRAGSAIQNLVTGKSTD